MWTDSWFDGMMCSNYFSCTYWSWLSVYTVDYLCWFHCAWDSNVPIGRKVKTGFLASGTEMPVESFPVRPSQIIFWQRAIWHCVRYVTQYQHMPCMLYFNRALPLGNAFHPISCWLSCICTPKGCFTMPNIWEWWWSQSDGAFLAEDIAKQPLLSPMKRWNKVFR